MCFILSNRGNEPELKFATWALDSWHSWYSPVRWLAPELYTQASHPCIEFMVFGWFESVRGFMKLFIVPVGFKTSPSVRHREFAPASGVLVGENLYYQATCLILFGDWFKEVILVSIRETVQIPVCLWTLPKTLSNVMGLRVNFILGSSLVSLYQLIGKWSWNSIFHTSGNFCGACITVDNAKWNWQRLSLEHRKSYYFTYTLAMAVHVHSLATDRAKSSWKPYLLTGITKVKRAKYVSYCIFWLAILEVK